MGFRREAMLPKGGPAGGNGGHGGSATLVADPSMNTLLKFKWNRVYKAGDGQRGGSNNRHGSDGESIEVPVPVGTEVWELPLEGQARDGVLLGDLAAPGQKMVVARGGRGGVGNAAFVSSVNQEPLLAEAGEEGERLRLRLNLKLLADIGLVGMPNAGKSSILAAISAARPKVADYPFTTLEPVLGVVQRNLDAFVIVDIPGLIEGAHQGVGLGDEFLKHVQRTRALVHVVDGMESNVAERIRMINHELEEFDPRLAARPQILAVNKLDTPEVAVLREDIQESIHEEFGPDQEVLFVSAATHDGLDVLIERMWQVLEAEPVQVEDADLYEEELPVLRPAGVQEPGPVTKEAEDVFRIIHKRAVRLAQGSNLDDWSARVQYQNRLGQMKVTDALQRMGVKQGDTVMVGDWEFEWE